MLNFKNFNKLANHYLSEVKFVEFYYCKSEDRTRACLDHQCRTCGTPEFFMSRFREELELQGGFVEDYEEEIFHWAEWENAGQIKVCESRSGSFERFIETIIDWIRRKKPLLHFQAKN